MSIAARRAVITPTSTPAWVRPAHLRLSMAAALLAAAASVTGLATADRVYGQETSDLVGVSMAQDIITVGVVAPSLIILGTLAARGSLRAYLCWLGCVAYTVYSYVIYAFAIHFGPLFLPWVAVLGLSFFALITNLTTVDTAAVQQRFRGRSLRVTGWTLVVLAVLFALLWLSEIIPDLLSSRGSTSAQVWLIPTNPVHVLDLAIFLPAVLISAISLLHRRGLGYTTAPGVFVFMALTCLPILVTPLVALGRGVEPAWAVMGPITVVLVVSAAVLWRTLRAVDAHPNHMP